MKREPAVRLQDLPNVGPAMAKDFLGMGFPTPDSLRGQDALQLYQRLCRETGVRHDPCVLDTFMSVTHYLETGERRNWWSFTEERKRRFPV